MPDQPTRLADVGQAAGGDRWHPVPVHAPGAGVVGEEGSLVLLAEALPELRGDRPESVEGRAPVAGLGHRVVDVGVDRVLQLRERAQAGDARGRWHGRSGGQPVDLGHQVVPRDRVQGAAGPVGGDGEVDHGQAGADEQQVAVGQLLRPRVGDQPGRGRDGCGRPVGAGSGAGREDDRPRHDRLAGREPDHEAVTAAVDAEHRLLATLEAGVAGVLGRGLEQGGEVVAVHPTRDEVLGLGLGVVVVADPAEEVLGVAREGAHPARGHVEQVAVVGGGVRRAAARRGGRVHQRDAVAGGEAGHQVGRRQRAGSAGPHHDHAAVALATSHRILLKVE